MAYKNRPKYIENQLKEINKHFREIRLKDDHKYDNELFSFFVSYLLKNKWYKGYNYYTEFTYPDGTVANMLAGPDYINKDYYIQIW